MFKGAYERRGGMVSVSEDKRANGGSGKTRKTVIDAAVGNESN